MDLPFLDAGEFRRLVLGLSGIRLRFDRRLINQHYGEAIPNGIDPLASRAFEILRILTVFQRLDAGRANQVFQQILRKHDWELYDRHEARL